jgi:hypothetical protein
MKCIHPDAAALQAVLLVAIVSAWSPTPIASAQTERVQWKHLSSSSGDFPPPNVGSQSATLVFDIDKDGKDEMVVAGWGDTSMVWYRKKGNS